MTGSSSPPPKRKPPAARRVASKSAAAAAEKTSTPAAEPGLVDQVRAMAGRLLDISSAAGVAGRALQTAGKVSRALRDGQALEAASEVVRAVLPSVAEPAAWGRTGATIRAMREAAGLTIAEVGAAIDLKGLFDLNVSPNGLVRGWMRVCRYGV